MLEETINSLVLVHKIFDLIHSIIVPEHSIINSPAIKALLLFNSSFLFELWNQILEKGSDLHVLSNIRWSITKFILNHRVRFSFFDQINDAFKVAELTCKM
jgi:hypothetical protein